MPMMSMWHGSCCQFLLVELKIVVAVFANQQLQERAI
jgi:D-alanyl-lipoteichoic acid acyltransferase DltB (MBOAT superfamily)